MSLIKVKIYFLDIKSPELFKPVPIPYNFTVMEVLDSQFEFNRFFYQTVGKHFDWKDRLCWHDEDWQRYLQENDVRLWIGSFNNSPIGYFELVKHQDQTVEIKYFGLLHRYIGQGFGKALLSKAIESAFHWSTGKKIILNTCSSDHPNALQNYLDRGFEIYQEKIIENENSSK